MGLDFIFSYRTSAQCVSEPGAVGGKDGAEGMNVGGESRTKLHKNYASGLFRKSVCRTKLNKSQRRYFQAKEGLKKKKTSSGQKVY